MTNRIWILSNFETNCFLNWEKINSGSELHDHISSNLKSYNEILEKLIRQANIQYYSDQLDKN